MKLLICISNSTKALGVLQEVPLQNLVATSITFQTPTVDIHRGVYGEKELSGIVISAGSKLCMLFQTKELDDDYRCRLVVAFPTLISQTRWQFGPLPIQPFTNIVDIGVERDTVTGAPLVSATVQPSIRIPVLPRRIGDRFQFHLLELSPLKLIRRRSLDAHASYVAEIRISRLQAK